MIEYRGDTPDPLAEIAADEANKEHARRADRLNKKMKINRIVGFSSTGALIGSFIAESPDVKLGLLAYAAVGIGYKAANLVDDHFTPPKTDDEMGREILLEYNARAMEAIRQRDAGMGDSQSYREIIIGNSDNKTSPDRPW